VTNDFDAMVREAFDQRADQAPRVDLARAAVQQAGSIRRRRRIVSGVAVLAVAAFVIPVGSQIIGDDKTDHTTSRPIDDTSPSRPVDVAIAGLSQGPAPAVPFLDNDKFVEADGTSTPILSGKGRVVDAVDLGDEGIASWRLDTTTGRTNYTSTGSPTDLPQGTSATNPAVDVQSKSTAWAVDGVQTLGGYAPSDVVLVMYSDGSFVQAGLGDLDVQQVMGVHDHEVLVNAREDGKARVALLDVASGAGTLEQPWHHVVNVTAVDPGFTRFAGRTPQMKGRERSCSAMLDFDSAQVQWQSCEWRPVEFSTDGSLVLAIGAGTDGLGPRELAVLNADDGSLVQSFTTQGTFGRATFEGTESIDAVTAVADQAAIVRCTIAEGDCELATAPAEVAPDEPDSLIYPYQLTAN
jgi:hypothetical protein